MTVGQLRKVFDDCCFVVRKDDDWSSDAIKEPSDILNECKGQWIEDNPNVAQMEVVVCTCGEWCPDESGPLESVVWVYVK